MQKGSHFHIWLLLLSLFYSKTPPFFFLSPCHWFVEKARTFAPSMCSVLDLDDIPFWCYLGDSSTPRISFKLVFESGDLLRFRFGIMVLQEYFPGEMSFWRLSWSQLAALCGDSLPAKACGYILATDGQFGRKLLWSPYSGPKQDILSSNLGILLHGDRLV